MDEERSRRIEELFDRVVNLSSDACETLLNEACADAPELRAEIESLLEHDHRRSAEFLCPPEAPEEIRGRPGGPDLLIGERIGRYRVESVIASGGMGTVYRAEQDSPNRVVALKLLRANVTSRRAMRHFHYESQILARLRHPNVAQVYEAGTYQAEDGGPGTPYFAMEYIHAARTITEYAESEDLGIQERLRLFIDTCEAVHHGHQKGVIHRDLKPGNILVDDSGRAKVIDFGVARSTDADLAVTTMRTEVGQLIGTLQYMSPEQCTPEAVDLDTRCDVYALGVVLHELLCGRLPYDLTRKTVAEAVHVICEQHPAKLGDVQRDLRGDLETIVHKALCKDRDARYASTTELAADLRRFIKNEPILARPPSMWYRSRKFVARNKVLVVVLATSLVALGAGITMVVNARLETALARREVEFRDRSMYSSRINSADRYIERRSWTSASEILDQDTSAFDDLVGWEWHYLRAQMDHSARSVHLQSEFACEKLMAISSDRARVAAICPDGSGDVWGAESGELLSTITASGCSATAVAFLSDGVTVVLGCSDGTVRIQGSIDPTGAWESFRTEDERGSVKAIAVDPSGVFLATAHRDAHEFTLWSVGDRAVVDAGPAVDLGIVDELDFRADGGKLAIAMRSGVVCLHDVKKRDARPEWWPTERRIAGVAFSDNGGHVMFWDGSNDVKALDTATQELVDLGGCPERITTLAARDTPLAFAAGTYEGNVCVWESEALGRAVLLNGGEGGTGGVQHVVFDQKDNTLMSVSRDHKVRTFDLDAVDARAVLGSHKGVIRSIAFSPAEDYLVSAGPTDGTIYVWDSLCGEELSR